MRPDNIDRLFLPCDPIIRIDRSFRVLRVGELVGYLQASVASALITSIPLSLTLSLSIPLYSYLSLSIPLYPSLLFVLSWPLCRHRHHRHLRPCQLIRHRRCCRCCCRCRRRISSAGSAASVYRSILPPIR